MNRSIALCAMLGILAAGCGNNATQKPRGVEATPGGATAEKAQGDAADAASSATGAAMILIGTEWLLEDLAGYGVLDGARGTIAFPDAGHIAGRASCNRFTGPCTVGEFTRADGLVRATFTAGQLTSTRNLCLPAINYWEQRYLAALHAAERIEIDGPYLKVYSKGTEKPLRFTRFGP